MSALPDLRIKPPAVSEGPNYQSRVLAAALAEPVEGTFTVRVTSRGDVVVTNAEGESHIAHTDLVTAQTLRGVLTALADGGIA